MDPGAMERETIDGVVNDIVELGILRNSLVSIAKDCGAVYVRKQREALLGAFNIFASATAFVGDFLQAVGTNAWLIRVTQVHVGIV
jgi:hypothetical protein